MIFFHSSGDSALAYPENSAVRTSSKANPTFISALLFRVVSGIEFESFRIEDVNKIKFDRSARHPFG